MQDTDGNSGFLFSVTQSGWFVAIVAATWGIILRAVIGRYAELQREAKAERELVLKSLEENRQAIASLRIEFVNRIALLENHDVWRRHKLP